MKKTVTEPTANITVSKNRLPKYDEQGKTTSYYLSNGQTFEIELHNPLKKDVLAKIYLNDISVTNGGIVLRPGERVFLERFIESGNMDPNNQGPKFTFNTYKVENTEENNEAISNNGNVKVEFYLEKVSSQLQTLGYTDWTFTPNYTTYDYYNTPIGRTNYSTFELTTSNVTNVNASLSTNEVPEIETGKIERGETSNQSFITVNKEFNHYTYNVVEYRILPNSQKVLTKQDIVVKKYCCECGTKQKKTNKFCPTCGTKQ